MQSGIYHVRVRHYYSNVSGHDTNYDIEISYKDFFAVEAYNGSNGDIDPEGMLYKYPGEYQQFTATPASEYTVDKWYLDGSPVQIGGTYYTLENIQSSHIVYVSFRLIRYALSVDTQGQGDVSLNPSGGIYNSGTVVELTAEEDSGWDFVRWEGDLSGSANPISILMNDNKNVTAVFGQDTPVQYSLTASVVNGNGSITPMSGIYNAGTVVPLTATPDLGYKVKAWSGTDNDPSAANNNNSITMNSNKYVMVEFERISATIHVDLTNTSGTENGSTTYPFSTIQRGIDAASDGAEVIVADGTYTGDGNRDIDFLGKAITVRSQNGPVTCIIDCQGTESEPHQGFYFHNGEDENSVIDGFTIRNGHALWEPTVGGGGICNHHASPTVQNCKFLSNYGWYGGAILDMDASSMLINCVFESNIAGGGGAIAALGSNQMVYNCIFHNNSARLGGAIAITYGEPSLPVGPSSVQLFNCTFIGNTAEFYGGAFFLGLEGTVNITNSILYGNKAPTAFNIYNNFNNNNFPTIDYCDVEAGINGQGFAGRPFVDGGGNMDEIPLFVESDSNDFHLLPSSPCIDAGNPSSSWESEPAPNGARVNMGAYGNTTEATTSRAGLQFTGFRIISKTRTGRTTWSYDLSLSLANVTDGDMTDVNVKLINADDQIINVVDDDILFPVIAAQSTVDSDSFGDYFTLEVDRSELIIEGRLTWQVDYTGTEGAAMQMMSANLPGEEDFQVTGDITDDDKVNLEDFAKMVQNWLQIAPLVNITGGDIIDIQDLAVLAEHWLEGVN